MYSNALSLLGVCDFVIFIFFLIYLSMMLTCMCSGLEQQGVVKEGLFNRHFNGYFICFYN